MAPGPLGTWPGTSLPSPREGLLGPSLPGQLDLLQGLVQRGAEGLLGGEQGGGATREELSLPLSVPRASPAGSSPQDRPGSGTQVGSFRGTVAVRTLKHGTPTPTGPWRTKVFLPESAPWALAIGHQVLLQPALGPQPGSDAVLGPDHCPRGAGRCSPASKMADGASQQTQDLKQLVPSDNQWVVEATFKGFLASSPIVTRDHILRG